MHCSLPVSSDHGVSQARILGLVAISFSRGACQPRDWTSISYISRQILYHLSQPGKPIPPARHTFSDLSRSSSLFLELKVKVKLLSHVRLFATPWTVAYRLLLPWDFPGKSTGVDCHFLLQGIFSTQGSNPGLLHCRQMLYHLSHQGSFFLELSVQLSSCLLVLLEHSVQNSTSCLSFLYTWFYFLHRICHHWIQSIIYSFEYQFSSFLECGEFVFLHLFIPSMCLKYVDFQYILLKVMKEFLITTVNIVLTKKIPSFFQVK